MSNLLSQLDEEKIASLLMLIPGIRKAPRKREKVVTTSVRDVVAEKFKRKYPYS